MAGKKARKRGGGGILGFLSAVLDRLASSFSLQMETLMADAKSQVQETIRYAIKSVVLLLIFVWGILFSLVGLALYLSTHVDRLSGGLGFLAVGLGLLLLGALVKGLQLH